MKILCSGMSHEAAVVDVFLTLYRGTWVWSPLALRLTALHGGRYPIKRFWGGEGGAHFLYDLIFVAR